MPHWMGPLSDECWKNRSKLGTQEHEAFFGDKMPWNMCIAELWSWRGQISKKLLGRMPTPEEIGLKADHWFFDPDVITVEETFTGRFPEPEKLYFFRGKRLRRDSPRLRRCRESLLRS